MEPAIYAGQVVDVMGDAYTLGDGAKHLLQQAITTCHQDGNPPPTARDLIQQIDQLPDRERIRGWKISALRALESVEAAALVSKDRLSQEQLVQALLHQSTIIELDALSQASKRFLVPLLALWLYSVRLAAPSREQLNLVIVLEEAHNVLYRPSQRVNEPILSMLLRQCRELGMAFIVVDQHPHLISAAALGNCYTSICLNQKDPKDVAKAAALSLVPEDEKQLFSRLPVGQGVVKLQGRWHDPFLIQIPQVDVAKGAVTDRLLGNHLRETRQNPACSAQKPRTFAHLGQLRRIQEPDDGLNPDELAFVGDVLAHPEDGVAARYRRLGFSGEKGNRIKLSLIEKDILEAQLIPVGRSRKVVLRLSKQGKEAVGGSDSGAPSTRKESIAHEYWKRTYARRYEDRGYRVQMEAPRVGGFVDVLAERDGRRIGIEVETGQSDVVANVKNCLREGLDEVIVVATSKQSHKLVEFALGKAGLLIGRRARLVRAV